MNSVFYLSIIFIWTFFYYVAFLNVCLTHKYKNSIYFIIYMCSFCTLLFVSDCEENICTVFMHIVVKLILCCETMCLYAYIYDLQEPSKSSKSRFQTDAVNIVFFCFDRSPPQKKLNDFIPGLKVSFPKYMQF